MKTAHRTASLRRDTRETQIAISLDLDGTGYEKLAIGFGFMDAKAAEVLFKAPKLIKVE